MSNSKDLLKEALEKYVENETRNNVNEKHKFSKEHRKKMNALWNNLEQDRQKKMSSLLKKAAMILIFLSVAGIFATATSSAWKNVVLRFFDNDEKTEKYASIIYSDSYNPKDSELITQDIEKSKTFFNYIPENYSIKLVKETKRLYYVWLEDEDIGEESRIYFKAYVGNRYEDVDKENAKYNLIYINDMEVFYIEEERNYFLRMG